MDLLIVFVKHPEPGKVKTRLAKTLGEEKALELYRRLLHRTCETASASPAEKLISYGNRVPDTDLWSEAGFQRVQQREGDLGGRMENAFEWGFANGYDRILLIGSDCADLSPAILNQGFDALARHDLVLGPANDGGYYLIGLKASLPAVFHNKPWSTDAVLRLTLASAIKEGKSLFLLPERIDIDTEEDLKDSFF